MAVRLWKLQSENNDSKEGQQKKNEQLQDGSQQQEGMEPQSQGQSSEGMEPQNSEAPQSGSQQQGMNTQDSGSQPRGSQQQGMNTQDSGSQPSGSQQQGMEPQSQGQSSEGMESQNSETPQSGSQQQGMNSQDSESQPSESQQQEGMEPQSQGQSSEGMESQNSEAPQSGSQQQGMNSQNSESQPSESQQQEGKPQNNGESSSEGQQDNKKSQNKEKPKKEHQEERKTQNKSTDNKTAKPSPERQFEETPEQKAAIKENQKKAQDMFRDLSSSRPQGSNHNNNWDGTFDDFGQEEVPQSVINKLVENFFDQVFSKKSDLNQKRNSAKQNPRGAVEWNTTAIITDKLTGNYMKMPRDKIGRKKESGDGTDIPLSFYFDLSGSMDMHIRFLSIMAYAMLKKGVKIIVGFNEFAYFQINEIPQNFKQDNFGEFMSEIQTMINNSMSMFFDDWDPDQDQNENLSRGSKKKNDKISRQIKKKTKVDITPLNGIKIDKYLIGNNAEKTVVFSDFDPRAEVVQLSKKCEVFWFCFEMNPCSVSDLSDFSGKFYKTTSEEDICKHLKNIKSISYEREQRRAATFGYCNPNNYGSPSNPSNSMGNSSQNPWEQGYQYNSGPNYNGYNPSDRFGW